MSLPTLEQRLQRAVARSEIEALNAEFAWRIDHGHSERVAELFLPEGSYGRADGGRSVGREALCRAYAARADRGPRVARHLFTNLRLVFGDDPDLVHGHCILLLYAEDGQAPLPAEANLVADYEDIYQRDSDGRWRYASRTVSHQFRHPGHKPVVLPLGQA
jgi:hypothetical protein